MKMIVGLGNPGNEYAGTRHNVGWMLVDALAEHLGINEWRSREKGMVAEGRIGSEKILLVKPLTYMNNSGECVGPLMRWYKLEPEDIMAAHDDMDIPIGTIRIRKKGSAGGHNGIKSLLSQSTYLIAKTAYRSNARGIENLTVFICIKSVYHILLVFSMFFASFAVFLLLSHEPFPPQFFWPF